ncbi:hypothetical protein GCM10007890_13460 [Methylobacterium tardum]|uniref:Uncharacterized protein n=1 Tax=Methylobacterium tardum TaxID=374432 RepID=A0AA37TJQ5_9HYPH|nr:hypothetical protein GCM10007890_13460 [Methylobacterium tardum]
MHSQRVDLTWNAPDECAFVFLLLLFRKQRLLVTAAGTCDRPADHSAIRAVLRRAPAYVDGLRFARGVRRWPLIARARNQWPRAGAHASAAGSEPVSATPWNAKKEPGTEPGFEVILHGGRHQG